MFVYDVALVPTLSIVFKVPVAEYYDIVSLDACMSVV
jgi:hypothetical protein